MRSLISNILSLVGATSFVVAAFLVHIIVGLVVVGVFSLLFSYFIGKED